MSKKKTSSTLTRKFAERFSSSLHKGVGLFSSSSYKDVEPFLSSHKDVESYSLLVDCSYDEHTLKLVNQFSVNSKKCEKHKYSFKLCWIVVGQPKDFDFDMENCPIILRSCNLRFEKGNLKGNKFIQIAIKELSDFTDIKYGQILHFEYLSVKIKFRG
ncbi:19725_t:CDS:1 [Dentiscutata erythropus]|uniref:19725_t:CDS:1 n=1 Tax=Dentiscutata erythropus TaxID=1348616 RepID=A0A9N9D7A1_9GLOM|nr:19725_t:CDS:1 [Dentiscutata erythropus]